MTPEETHQHMRDDSHIRLLVIFYYIMGGLTLLGGTFLIGVSILMKSTFSAMMAASSTTTSSSPSTTAPATLPSPGTPSPTPTAPTTPTPPPPEAVEAFDSMTNFFLLFYGAGGLIAILLGILSFVSAKGMTSRKWQTFSLVVAGIHCLNIPLGTVLGVFTFIVLLRPTVQAQYLRQQHPSVPA